MLQATERASGGGDNSTGSKKVPVVNNDTPTLAELGINKKTSSLAQKLSALPDDKPITLIQKG